MYMDKCQYMEYAAPMKLLNDKVFQMRASDGWLAELDDWRAQQRPVLSRAESIRRLTALGIGAEPILRDLLRLMESLPDNDDLGRHIADVRKVLNEGE